MVGLPSLLEWPTTNSVPSPGRRPPATRQAARKLLMFILRGLSIAQALPHCRGEHMNKPITDLPHPKMLLDPYASWAAGEGVPITEDFGVDLLSVPTAPWARFGVDGALVHLKGRGDFVSIFVLELAPGAKSAPQKHLFEEVVYVLSGHGNTT